MDTSVLRRNFSFLLVLVLAFGWPDLTRAQNAVPELRVATFIAPPFVIKEGDQLTGFSIELWEEIAARLNVKSSYAIVTDAKSGLQLLQSNSVDIGVSGIFYSTELDRLLDFTYPTLNAGLRVMVRGQAVGDGMQLHPLHDWLALVFSRSAALWLLAALFVALIPAHVVWLLDRTNEDGVSPTKNYFPGIFHSMFWAMTAVASQAPVMPRQWIARVFGVIWIFAGLVFVALFTAQLTALLTVAEIRGAINGPDDLPGKRVGTLAASVPATYLRKIGADVQEFPSLDEMYQALLEKKVDAVVLHAPVLNYYAAHEGRGRVKMVGPEVEKKDIGFVVPLGSPLRKRVSNQLLALYEDGTYYRIYAKWFGNE
jgi:polar amino acid transport system substrate-binding protein